MRSILIANIVVALLFVSSCYGEPSHFKNAISISGSTTCLPVVSKAADIFMRKHPQTAIAVSAGGSGAGISAIGKGAVDIGMVSRNISEGERKDYPKVNSFLTPFARDAVVPVVSAEIYESGITCLSLAQIRDIYTRRLKNWKDLGGPDREILLVDKEPGRGTRHVFFRAVFGDEHPEVTAGITTGPNDDMQMAVATSDAAIGFLSHAWTNDKVKGLGIKTEGNIVLPTITNIRTGHFPISRNLSFVTNGPPKGTAKEFIDFVLSPEAQRMIIDTNLMPLN